MGVDLTTLLIWGLRIVLPILFFAIYFRFQAPPKQTKFPGPTTNVHSRDKLVLLRSAVKGEAAPESMKNIALKDQSQAPHLFGGGRAPRADRSNRRVPADGEEKKEKPERGERKEKKEKTQKKEEPTEEATRLIDEKMHLESLLNYIAFNRLDDTNTHLDGHEKQSSQPKGENATHDAIAAAIADKANDEAQMVLRGAIAVGRADVAKHLYGQLSEAHVEITERTFELLIDVCLAARDLKGASDFLLKLETAGFTPKTELLDKVLDLYSTQQAELPEHTKAEAPSHEDALNDLLSEAIISQTAAEVSTNEVVAQADGASTEFYAPAMMPMFNWDAIDDSDDSGDEQEGGSPKKLSPEAAVFVPTSISNQDPTKMLSAAAATFEPGMTWDPNMYQWGGWEGPTVDFPEASQGGKGKGKGKGKWKGNDWNDDWKANDNWNKPRSWDDDWKAGGGKSDWKAKASKEEGEKDESGEANH